MHMEVLLIQGYVILVNLFWWCCCFCLKQIDHVREKEHRKNLAIIALRKEGINQCAVRYENKVQPTPQAPNTHKPSNGLTFQAIQAQLTRQTCTLSEERNVSNQRPPPPIINKTSRTSQSVQTQTDLTYSNKQNATKDTEVTELICSDEKRAQPTFVATTASVHQPISDSVSKHSFRRALPTSASIEKPFCPSKQAIPTLYEKQISSHKIPITSPRILKATIATDASKYGFGGYCILEDLNLIKYYSVRHQNLSSEFRINDIFDSGELEMKNLLFALKQFRKDAAGRHLTLLTDSTCVNSMHNRYAQTVHSFLNELVEEENVVHANVDDCYVNSHTDTAIFQTYILPADMLSRFYIHEFLDCMEDIYPNMKLQRIWIPYFN